MTAIFQCAPNFSEGRNTTTVEAIADAIRESQDATLIDYSADVDHNRCVMTILGAGEAIVQAMTAASRIAVERIDLRRHTGVHPRIGAIDVVPVVPVQGADMAEAIDVAEQIGANLSGELLVPVYFYERNARANRTADLPAIRKGGFEAIRDTDLVGDRAPDLGPGNTHLSAGVAVVGTRGPLVAYNVNLGSPDVEIAKAIARTIREQRNELPELEGVRALGLYLASQQRAQVSLNLTRPDRTTLPAVFGFIAREADRLGVRELESEIIGAIPAASLGGAAPQSIHWHTYKPTQVLETWLEESLSADDADKNG